MDRVADIAQSETFWLFVTLLVAGTLATHVWRMAGVFLSRDLRPDSPFIVWAKDVSVALLAGFVGRFLFFPPEALVEFPLALRLFAFASGVLVYFLSGRQVVLGIGYGLGVLVLVQWALRS